MTDEKHLEKIIWRVIPVEYHNQPFADQLTALNNKFRLDGQGGVDIKIPQPETAFEKEIYLQFRELINSHNIQRIEYVVPLIKEFVIDNEKKEAALLFRYQMDFAVGKGFQMKEMAFFGKKGEKFREIYENHAWTGATHLDYMLSQMAKTHLDPMLYLLKGNYPVQDIDLYDLNMDEDIISFKEQFFPGHGKKKEIKI